MTATQECVAVLLCAKAFFGGSTNRFMSVFHERLNSIFLH
jgi:hypothetical protein